VREGRRCREVREGVRGMGEKGEREGKWKGGKVCLNGFVGGRSCY